MICSKCGFAIPAGSTVCPRCAERESAVEEMDLELKRLLEKSDTADSKADATEKTIVAGASIQAAVKAAADQKQAVAARSSQTKPAVGKPAGTAAKRPADATVQKTAGAQTRRPAPAAGQKATGAQAGKTAAGAQAVRTAAGQKNAAAGKRPAGTAAKQTASGNSKSSGKKTNSKNSKKRKAKKRGGLVTVLVAVIVAVVLVCAAVGGITAYAMKYAKYDKILPNVYVAGIDVSGLTVEEALQVVEDNYGYYEQKGVDVQLPDQVLTFTPAEGAVVMNPEIAVSEAYNYGRGKNSPFALARAIRAAKKTENNIDISTAVTVNTDSICETVRETAASVNQPLVETSIEVDKEHNEVTVNVGTEGRSLDTDQLCELVCNAFSTGNYSTIDFEYIVEYPAAITLDSVYEMMVVEPKNAKYNPKTDKISESEDGILPDIELEEANEMLAAAQQGEELVFTFSKAKADYDADELEEVLFRDTLDTTTSEIVDSDRLDNIEIACEALDDTVVQPGASFSFNDTLGTVGYAAGYKDADVYPGDDSDSMMGGGISQVSSALYESCLYADLQITERHAHQYLPNFAKAGLDAYVKSGESDLQFVNSSIYPIRIHASVNGQTLKVYIEGTDENSYDVQLDVEQVSEDPYETDYNADVIGYDGAEYHVTRTITDKDGKEVRKDSTEDLDAMAGCGTSVYTRRDGSDYTEPVTTTTNTNTSGSSSSSSGNYNYYTTPVPTTTTETTTVPTTEPTTETTTVPTTEPTTETTTAPTTAPATQPATDPVTPGGGGESGGGATGGGDTGGGATGGGDTGGGGAVAVPVE